MCQVDRRSFLAKGAALAATAASGPAGARAQAAVPDGFVLRDVAPGVSFAEGDAVGKGYSNNGWIVLEDYVLVVDATYPGGASGLLQLIRSATDRPVRFAFDTHHHGDHLYGNDVYTAVGATPVAHSGVLDEVRRLETGHFGGPPGRWEGEAKERPELRGRQLKPPSLLFPSSLYFDDGKRRVELVHFGMGHTKGDACAWMPKEGILFTGDAAVNGPFNFVGDGNVEAWIKTLEEMKKIAPRIVCPGHGPVGDATILADQQAFFQALWDLVGEGPRPARAGGGALDGSSRSAPRSRPSRRSRGTRAARATTRSPSRWRRSTRRSPAGSCRSDRRPRCGRASDTPAPTARPAAAPAHRAREYRSSAQDPASSRSICRASSSVRAGANRRTRGRTSLVSK